MPTFEEIYAQHAAQYDALVAREDYQGNILRTLQEIHPLAGADVVEFGAGTGRLTRLLAPVVRSIRAYDQSAHMLSVAETTLKATGATNWRLEAADNRALPVESASADMSIAGWSFGHATVWNEAAWRADVEAAVDEMLRVVRPGGVAVILETMGTGSDTPQPPTQMLADYYAYLERERGFSATAIRTDYQFASLDEAVGLTTFFFGDQMGERVQREGLVTLPECTGVWWRRV
jgi:ubiquinone/menaquinone biosynthesis C-methylase UbiE